MLRNYLKIGYRNLLKNKVPSVINIVGLSIAIACCIVVYLFLQVYLSFDAFHENGERIFLVQHVVEQNGELQPWGTTPMPLGPALEADLPQVERAVRMERLRGTVHRGPNTFDELVSFADVGFFDTFTFPLQSGSPEALADPSAVILSHEAAARYFGDDDPMGRQLAISFGGGPPKTFTVEGVAEEFPSNTGFDFEVLLSFDRRLDIGSVRADDWQSFVGATFIQVRAPSDVETVAGAMDRYRTAHNAVSEERQIQRFRFDNLRDPPFDAYTVRQRLVDAAHPVFIGMMAAIALFMLALACFNYINIALGAATRRLQEVGVRKAVGSSKQQLVVQFLSENVLLCGGALLVGLALAQAVLIPLFNDLFVIQIGLSWTQDLELWVFLVGLLMAVAVISGAYPAFYVASFQPTAIFRGEQRVDRKAWYTHAFLTFQFVLAFVAVIVGVLLALNGRYMANLDWGYAADQTLVVRLTDGEQFSRLHDEAIQHPSIERVAGAQHHVGAARSAVEVRVEGESEEVFRYKVGPGYFEAAGLRLQSGRTFDARRGSETATSVVVNEAFAQEQGWEQPIGKTIRFEETTYRIIGVVGDFRHTALAQARPVLFQSVPEARYQYMVVRFAPGAGKQALASVRDLWDRRGPDTALDYFFQDTVFDQNLRTYQNLTAGVGYLAALALLIACMGLFGLASQNVARRLKEISIRKVLGASLPPLVLRVNRRFLMLLGIAAAVATVGSYVALETLLGVVPDHVTHMPLGPTPFVVANALVFCTATLSVATQIYTLIDTNPAEILRNE